MPTNYSENEKKNYFDNLQHFLSFIKEEDLEKKVACYYEAGTQIWSGSYCDAIKFQIRLPELIFDV